MGSNSGPPYLLVQDGVDVSHRVAGAETMHTAHNRVMVSQYPAPSGFIEQQATLLHQHGVLTPSEVHPGAEFNEPASWSLPPSITSSYFSRYAAPKPLPARRAMGPAPYASSATS